MTTPISASVEIASTPLVLNGAVPGNYLVGLYMKQPDNSFEKIAETSVNEDALGDIQFARPVPGTYMIVAQRTSTTGAPLGNPALSAHFDIDITPDPTTDVNVPISISVSF